MKHFSNAEVAAKFKQYIRVNFENQTHAGEHYGVSRQFISAAVHEKNRMNSDMLDDLGLERVTVYIKAK